MTAKEIATFLSKMGLDQAAVSQVFAKLSDSTKEVEVTLPNGNVVALPSGVVVKKATPAQTKKEGNMNSIQNRTFARNEVVRIKLGAFKTLDEAIEEMLKSAPIVAKALKNNKLTYKVSGQEFSVRINSAGRKVSEVLFEGSKYNWVVRVQEPDLNKYPGQKGCCRVLVYNTLKEGRMSHDARGYVSDPRAVRKNFILGPDGKIISVQPAEEAAF